MYLRVHVYELLYSNEIISCKRLTKLYLKPCCFFTIINFSVWIRYFIFYFLIWPLKDDDKTVFFMACRSHAVLTTKQQVSSHRVMYIFSLNVMMHCDLAQSAAACYKLKMTHKKLRLVLVSNYCCILGSRYCIKRSSSCLCSRLVFPIFPHGITTPKVNPSDALSEHRKGVGCEWKAWYCLLSC